MLMNNANLIMSEAERTLGSLNGELDGAEFRGYVCGPLCPESLRV